MKTAISIDPVGKVEVHELPDVDSNEGTQKIHDLIGGYLQLVPHVPGSMFCNEDGQRLNLPINYVASLMAGQPILGTVVILGPANSKGDTTTIDPKQREEVEIAAADWRDTLAGVRV